MARPLTTRDPDEIRAELAEDLPPRKKGDLRLELIAALEERLTAQEQTTGELVEAVQTAQASGAPPVEITPEQRAGLAMSLFGAHLQRFGTSTKELRQITAQADSYCDAFAAFMVGGDREPLHAEHARLKADLHKTQRALADARHRIEFLGSQVAQYKQSLEALGAPV